MAARTDVKRPSYHPKICEIEGKLNLALLYLYTSRTMRKSHFCICQKAQISSVSTQVDQSLCFFAALIENLPALTEKYPKILNPK